MKDFDTWNKKKKHIESNAYEHLTFHEREIWWCSIGHNIGDEQDGKNKLFERPVLVIKKFNDKICWTVPMSTKQKKGVYYHSLEYDGKTFSVLLSQLRLTSVKRFRRHVRKILHTSLRRYARSYGALLVVFDFINRRTPRMA